MSWEDCGFRPGKIHGPPKCPRGACSDCDGEHHFDAESVDPEHLDPDDSVAREAVAAGHTEYFACRHCDTWATMVDEDDELDVAGTCAAPGCFDRRVADEQLCLFDLDDLRERERLFREATTCNEVVR